MATKRDTVDAAVMGQGCLGRSAEDEPVFTLCARDPLAADIVREWANRLEQRARAAGALDARRARKIGRARLDADEMDAWRDAHGGGKLPD